MSAPRKQQIEAARKRIAAMESVDDAAIARAFRRCVGRNQSDSWFSTGNPIVPDPSGALSKDRETQLEADFEDFVDFVAVSSLLHCFDAWSYLSGAMAALVSGRRGEAVHLAYYGELRAAISILSANGVSVSNNGQYAVKQESKVEPLFASGTHIATWRLLEEWSSTTRGSRSIASMIRLQGQDLGAWLGARVGTGVRARSAAGSADAVVSALLQDWVLDIRAYSEDKSRRDRASYLPGGFLFDDDHGDRAEWTRLLVAECCALVEPSTPGRFPVLDLHLVAQALRGANAALSGSDEMSLDEVGLIAESVLGSRGTSPEIAQSLHLAVSDSSSVVNRARSGGVVSLSATNDEIAGLFGRGLILARIATGFQFDLHRRAGVDRAELAKWTDGKASALGLWNPAPRPAALMELWDEMRDSRDDLEVLFPRGVDRISTLRARAGASLGVSTELNRVPIWSLSA